MVYMGEGEELWNKYCSFLDMPFSKQLEYNERRHREHFERWKHTKMANQLCKNVKEFEEVPLTNYQDYTILHKFGAEMEKLSKEIPRKEGELMWDYYERIGKQVAPMLDGWLVGEYAFGFKTSGTSGEPKWVAHSEEFLRRNFEELSAIPLILGCSDGWGNTNIRKGDKILCMWAPAPYASGLASRVSEKNFTIVPPIAITDNITEMRKKINFIYKLIKTGEKIDMIMSSAPLVHLLTRYFTEPEKLYKDNYQSFGFGFPKIALYMKWIKSKINPEKFAKGIEVMPVKGVMSAAVEIKPYSNFIQEQYDVVPLDSYASSEISIAMMGTPDNKDKLSPLLFMCYFEFLSSDGEVKKINELKKGRVYEIVVSPFDSLLMRYRMDDLFRVTAIRDDGMPILEFESRTYGELKFYGYFRLTQRMITEIMQGVGLPIADKWAAAKITDPMERLLILMEKELEHSEDHVGRLVFKRLIEINPDFKSYVKDFNIKKAEDVIKVEYLRKGAFLRYTLAAAKKGQPFGQMKPPKMIPQDKQSIVELLRS